MDNYKIADKLNIDVNKDFYCINYMESYLSCLVMLPNMPPSDAESVSWRLSTGGYLKSLYQKYGAELSDEAVEMIDSLSCDPIF